MRDLGSFARFVEGISFSHASPLNLANVARECDVSRKTAEGYLAVLDDLLLAFQVPVVTRRAKRQLQAHAKFFWLDAGVYRSARPAGPLDRPERSPGRGSKGWSPSIYARGSTTRAPTARCRTGAPSRETRWTSWCTGAPGSGP